jgi:hypothetical protein
VTVATARRQHSGFRIAGRAAPGRSGSLGIKWWANIRDARGGLLFKNRDRHLCDSDAPFPSDRWAKPYFSWDVIARFQLRRT